MAKQLRRLMLLVAALAVAGCAALVLLAGPEAEPPAADPAATAQPLLPAGPVQRAEVQNSHGSYTMTPNAVDGLSAELIETVYLETVFDGLHALSLERVEGVSVKDAVYGLEAPAANVQMHYAGGESRSLRIGVKEGVSKRYYCSLNDADDVYLMNGTLAQRLLMPVQGYLSMQVTPDCRASSPLSAIGDISFVTKEQEIRIRTSSDAAQDFSRELLSFGAVTHVVQGPGIWHEVDRTYAQEIFDSLFDVYAEELVAYGLTEEEILQKGFASPDLTVQFNLKNGDLPGTPVQPYTLRLLHQEDGSSLVTVNQRGIIYRIAAEPFMQADYARFVNRWFLSPLLADLKSLRISTPGVEHLYEISGTAADLHVAKHGQELPIARFRSFYSLAVSAASNGDYLGLVQMEGKPEMTVEFAYRDENKAPDVLELYALDDRRFAVAVNGVTEYAMRSNYAQTLMDAINALETDAEIPQTW